MASTYTSNIGVEKIGAGEQAGTWGTTTNNNLDILDRAINGVGAITLSGTTHTLTTSDGTLSDGGFAVLVLGGSPSGTNTITISPNDQDKVYIVQNSTSQTATFTQGSGADISVAAGSKKIIFADGAGSGAVVYDMLQDLAVPDLFVDDDLKLQSDSAVLGFGADNDTTLTHTDGTGLTLNSTNKICFNDASQFIQGSSATVLSLGATDEIDLTATAVDLNGTLDVSGNSQFSGTITVGVDDTGLDVKFFGATAGKYMLWDESADSLLVNGDIDMVTNGNRIDLDTDNDTSIRASADDTITIEVGGSDLIALTTTSTFSCPLTVGVDDTGHDVNFFGATSGQKVFWDESADTLYQTCTVDIDGTVTVGVDDTGYDVKFFGATASAYMLWDESADDLILAGAARVVVPASGFVIGSTAVTTTAAELNLLDAITRGSIIVGNASGASALLGVGSNGQALVSDGTDISWGAAGATTLNGLTDCKTFGTESLMIGDASTGTIDAANYNTGVGIDIFAALTTGDNNTVVGNGSGAALTSGAGNVFLGKDTGLATTTGPNNVFIGLNAGKALVSTEDNIAIGSGALDGASSTSCSQVIAIGTDAGGGALAGYNNVYIGYQSGLVATSTLQNTGVGGKTFLALTTANENTAFGYESSEQMTTGTGNVTMGFQAGDDITTGSYSVVIGYDSANGMTTGPSNVVIGAQACDGATEIEKCVMIGRLATHSATNNDSMIVIGYNSTGKGDSTGFINAGGGANYAGNNSASWSTTSDRRIKKNITDNTIGLDEINQIQVRNFEYRTVDEIVDFDNAEAAVVEKEGLQLGVIAQEIEEVLPNVVSTTSQGVKSVDPDNITWHLVNAVQELTTQVETLKQEVATLKGE